MSSEARLAAYTRYAGTITESAAGSPAYTNPNNMLGAPDATYATVVCAAATLNKIADCTNYGFTVAEIPDAVTVALIKVTLRWLQSAADGVEMTIARLYGVDSASWSAGSNLMATPVTFTETTATDSDLLGSSLGSDRLWGLTGADTLPASMRDSNFGYRFRLRGTTGAVTTSVDSAAITIYTFFRQTIVPNIETGSGIRRYILAWQSDASGNVDGYMNGRNLPLIQGRVLRVVTIPMAGVVDDYDVSLTDELGNDVLQSKAQNRDSTTLETVYIADPTQTEAVVRTAGPLRFRVTNAGAAQAGTSIITVVD